MIFTKFFLPLVANFLSVILRYKSSSRSHQKRHSSRFTEHISFFYFFLFFLIFLFFGYKIFVSYRKIFFGVRGSCSPFFYSLLKFQVKYFFREKVLLCHETNFRPQKSKVLEQMEQNAYHHKKVQTFVYQTSLKHLICHAYSAPSGRSRKTESSKKAVFR